MHVGSTTQEGSTYRTGKLCAYVYVFILLCVRLVFFASLKCVGPDLCMFVCVCVCVLERETDRQRERKCLSEIFDH